MPITPTFCLNCQKPITKGRADKKFCNPDCKDEYYNEIKIKENKEISKIDGILKRNRRAIKRLFDPKQPEKNVLREDMIREGFEFGFSTHVAITKAKSNEIIFCYDYGYREVKEKSYQLFHSFSKVQVKDGYVIKID